MRYCVFPATYLAYSANLQHIATRLDRRLFLSLLRLCTRSLPSAVGRWCPVLLRFGCSCEYIDILGRGETCTWLFSSDEDFAYEGKRNLLLYHISILLFLRERCKERGLLESLRRPNARIYLCSECVRYERHVKSENEMVCVRYSTKL